MLLQILSKLKCVKYRYTCFYSISKKGENEGRITFFHMTSRFRKIFLITIVELNYFWIKLDNRQKDILEYVEHNFFHF